ncbi:MAG: AMP-dependent synthetase/ligase [Candidatus Zixiibacteriota bacterium]
MYIPDMSEASRTQVFASPNLVEAFAERVPQWPNQVAILGDGGNGRSFTYAELLQAVSRLSAGLRDPAFAAVESVAILSENRPEWPLAYLAVLAAGKTVVPIDSYLKPLEILYVLNHSGAKLAFVSGRFEEELSQLAPSVLIYSLESDSRQTWRSLFRDESNGDSGKTERPAVVIYTSGTTGNPRGVLLSHRNLLSNLEGIQAALSFGQSDRFLSVLPLHHAFEATCGFLTPLMAGATIVYARSFRSKEILQDIATNRITLMCGVPLLYDKMYHAMRRGINAAPRHRRWLFRFLYVVSSVGWKAGFRWGKPLFAKVRQKAGLGTIRMLVSGGAAIPPEIARFFNLLGIDFIQGYGMTECSPVISVNRPSDITFASVGPPLPNVEVKIDQPDDTGVGEIMVRGGCVTSGYRANPAKTAELLRDGWLHTGDIGCIRDRHLYITGRSKNVIVSAAGKNIYPEEIEEKLLESPYILETVVFGRKKEGRQGEEVRAIIVPDLEQFRAEYDLVTADSDPDLLKRVIGEAVETVNGQMAEFKRISSYIVQVQELEKTSTKKVKRYVYNRSDADGSPAGGGVV